MKLLPMNPAPPVTNSFIENITTTSCSGLKRRIKILEILELAVFFGECRFFNWPIDIQCWVVPDDPGIGFGRVESIHFIHKVRVVFQRAISVGKSARDEKHLEIFPGELKTFPFSKSRRMFAKIHNHIIYFPPRDPHQLCLRVRRLLKMKPAQDSL